MCLLEVLSSPTRAMLCAASNQARLRGKRHPSGYLMLDAEISLSSYI